MDLSTTEPTGLPIDGSSSVNDMTDNATSLTSHGRLYQFDSIWYGCFVVMGVILPLGLVCNTLSFVVFVTSKAMIKTSTGHYLVALSAADWLFLAADLIRWLHTASPTTRRFYLDVDFMFTNQAACKLTHFVRYGSKLTSAWITIAITIERFISVRWPLHAHQMSTVSRARLAIGVTYAACFGLGAYPLWTVAVGRYEDTVACRIVEEAQYNTWSWISLRIGSLLLPGLIMFVFTALIILSLAKARDQRLGRLSSRQMAPRLTTAGLTSDGARSKQQAVPKQTVQRQLTVILLAVAVSFVLLRLPYTVTYYLNNFKMTIWPKISQRRSLAVYTVNRIADVIATSNYAINFFLYCVCGSAFRSQLRSLGCSWTRDLSKNGGAAYVTVSVSLTERTSPFQTRLKT